MSVYNEPLRWIDVSVMSILDQTHDQIELIMIIDDPTRYDVGNYMRELQRRDARVNFYFNEYNMGLIKSLNKALSFASGDYIARMDADDCSHLDRFEKQINYLEKFGLDLVGSNVNLFNETDGVFFRTNKLIHHKSIKALMWCGTIGIVHPTFFAKRIVYDSLGSYSYAPHVEDKEFLARAIINDFKVGNHPEVLLDCRYSNHSVTKKNAVYVYKMGSYVTFAYRKFFIIHKYVFNENFFSGIKVSDREKLNYQRAKQLMSDARRYRSEKNYTYFMFAIFKALSIAPNVLIRSIVLVFCSKILGFYDQTLHKNHL